jgi:hypothetical protein
VKGEKMNRIGTLEFSVVLVLVIILLGVSARYTQAQQQVIAHVLALPTAYIDCKPDELTIGSNVKWINCFIELDGADVSDIDISSLTLRAVGKPGVASADSTFAHLDDFDSDGKPDLQVRFNRTFADENWFFGINTTTRFTLVLNGTVDVFPFGGTDGMLLVKSSPFEHATYYQPDTKVNVPKENIKYIEGVNLSLYAPDTSTFGGYFVSTGDPDIFGVNAFYSEGYLEIPRVIDFWIFNFTIYDRQKITIAASFRRYDDCFADKITKRVHCEGSGVLLVRNHRIERTSRYVLDTMRFDVNDFTVAVEGGKFWNDMVRVSGVKIKRIMIT